MTAWTRVTSTTCDTPPANFCIGDDLFSYGATGNCFLGSCDYPETVTDCSADGRICSPAAGACVDPCGGVTCDEPPANTCAGDVLTAYPNPGTCGGGTCAYPPTTVNCADTGDICDPVSGACVDPCLGVTCDSPPAAFCQGDDRHTFDSGLCLDGSCEYLELIEDCSMNLQVCDPATAACVDPCTLITCDMPPADFCTGNILTTHPASGICSGGACSYAPTTTDCAASGDVCDTASATCVDPCDGVTCDTPPAAFCDAGDSHTFASTGTCSGGTCSYTETVTTCADSGDICDAGTGLCVDPCAGVVCDTPPANFCQGDDRHIFDPNGLCIAGSCSYTELIEDCSLNLEVCDVATATCVDPCDSITCDMPPAAFCDGSDRLHTFAAMGSCFGGSCDYTETISDCAEGGLECDPATLSCVDPCDGVTCDMPPAGSCMGNVLSTYAPMGTCSGGMCSYTETQTDCAATGLECDAMTLSCVDPCSGRTCDMPPDNFCDGDEAVVYPSSGTCSGGSCSYPEMRNRLRVSRGTSA